MWTTKWRILMSMVKKSSNKLSMILSNKMIFYYERIFMKTVIKKLPLIAMSLMLANSAWSGFHDCEPPKIISKEYERVGCLRSGLAVVQKNGKYGYVNKDGKVAIPLEYDDANYFLGHIARVKKGNKYGYIDTNYKIVIPIKYDDIENLNFTIYLTKENGKYGFIDKTGKTVVEHQYDDARGFNANVVKVAKNGKYGLTDYTGKIFLPLEYDEINFFSPEDIKFDNKGNMTYTIKAKVKKDGEEFYINEQGQRIQ